MQTLGLFLSNFTLPVFERICLMLLKSSFNNRKVGQIRWLVEPLPGYAWGRGGRYIRSTELN